MTTKRHLRSIAAAGLIAAVFTLLPTSALAGYWDASVGFNYNRSEYAGGSFTWSRRLGGSLGYNFSDSSTLEVAYQKSYERNHYQGFEDSFYRDEVYSTNLVWNLFGRESQIQPYFKVGVGQLNRKATINDSAGRVQNQILNQLTGVVGAGLRLRLTPTFGIRMEGTSYLAGGKLSSWKNNFGATFGISLFF